MNLFQITLLITLIINLLFGVAVMLKNTRRRQNQGFFILSLVLAAWLSCLLASTHAATRETLAFWIRQSSVSSALIPIALYLLLLAMTAREAGWASLLGRCRWWLAAFAGIIILCQTPLFLVSVDLPVAGSPLATPAYGPGFLVFLAYMAASVLLLGYFYYRDTAMFTGIKRVEVQFMLIGCLFGLTTGVLLLIAANLTNLPQLGQLLPLPVLAMDAIVAYGVATRSILDVPNVIRRLVSWLVIIPCLGLLYAATWWLTASIMNLLHQDFLPAAHFMAALVVAFAVSPAQGWMFHVSKKLFLSSPLIDVGDSIQQASRILNAISTVDELFRQIALLVHDQIQNENLRILIRENDHFAQHHASGTAPDALSYPAHHPLVTALEAHGAPLVSDLIQRLPASRDLAEAEREMNRQGVAAAVAIQTKGKVIGMMLLGPRASGRIYGSVEQSLLTGLCDRMAVSLENAKLYTEVQNSRIYNDILLDRLVSGVIAVNAGRQITVFNREAQRITGLRQEEVLHAGIDVLPELLREALQHSLAEGGDRDVEGVLRTGNREVPIRFGFTAFRGHDGNILGALLAFTDQTELKKLEQQIRRTDRLASLGTLSAGMAHEIKNPLVAMKTFTQLLPERYDDPDFRQTFSTLVGDEVSRIDRIVNHLLRFARPAKPSLTPLHLHTNLDNSLNLLKQNLRQQNIALNVEYLAENDLIQGDADLLAQALLNFLLNAIDAMPEGGTLYIKTAIIQQPTRQNDLSGKPVTVPHLRLSIADTGEGIAKEDLGHVFDPFYTTKASGTGLGLSVAHGIIQEHHGVIDVESTPGKGTTFDLLFPVYGIKVTA